MYREEVDCAPVRVESGGPVTLQRKCLGEHPDSVSLLAAVLVAEGVDRGARKLEPPFAVAAHQRQPRLNDTQHAEVQRFWRRAEQLRGNLDVRLRRFPMLVGDFHARRHEMSARQVCRVLGHLQERDRVPDRPQRFACMALHSGEAGHRPVQADARIWVWVDLGPHECVPDHLSGTAVVAGVAQGVAQVGGVANLLVQIVRGGLGHFFEAAVEESHRAFGCAERGVRVAERCIDVRLRHRIDLVVSERCFDQLDCLEVAIALRGSEAER